MTRPIDVGRLPPGSQIANYLYPDLDPEERHQDLLIIVLPTGYSIHVGWFPEYHESGEFWIRAAWQNGELPPIKRIASITSRVRSQQEAARISGVKPYASVHSTSSGRSCSSRRTVSASRSSIARQRLSLLFRIDQSPSKVRCLCRPVGDSRGVTGSVANAFTSIQLSPPETEAAAQR